MRTPEENKIYMKEYYLKNKDRYRENSKKYREENKELIKSRKKEYREKNKDAITEKNRQWYNDNKDRILASRKDYYKANKETIAVKKKESRKQRASCLLSAYKYDDIKHGREGFNLTQQFILEHIFNHSCIYCGETDWHKLGCDRIDNTKGHTTDNVVCSCWDCNNKRRTIPFQEFLLSQNPSSAFDILSSLGLQQ